MTSEKNKLKSKYDISKYETVLIKQAKYLFYLMKAGEIKPETFYLK